MSNTNTKKLDPWADWLLRGRQQSGSQASVTQMHRDLQTIRDRVLAEAQLTSGAWVLDAGAGTGLLALEACTHVGPTGRVCALDLSHDALSMIPREAVAEPSLNVGYNSLKLLEEVFQKLSFQIASQYLSMWIVIPLGCWIDRHRDASYMHDAVTQS